MAGITGVGIVGKRDFAGSKQPDSSLVASTASEETVDNAELLLDSFLNLIKSKLFNYK
jgi:hypothetical protein